MSSDIIKRLILDSHRPGLAQISREWRDQYTAAMQRVTIPSSQKEILAACRADNWMAIVAVRPRADYYFCWHTRCKVHIFCSFEMICLYEMVFCGVGRHTVLNSLRIAPEYMLLNEDQTIWERTGPHEWRDYYDSYKEAFVNRGAQFDGMFTSLSVSRLLFMMELVSGYDANVQWSYDCISRQRDVDHDWMHAFWISSVKRGLFDTSDIAWERQKYAKSFNGLESVIDKMVKQEYLEGIDYLISKGLWPSTVSRIAYKTGRYRISLYYKSSNKLIPALDSGTVGREQILRHAQKRVCDS